MLLVDELTGEGPLNIVTCKFNLCGCMFAFVCVYVLIACKYICSESTLLDAPNEVAKCIHWSDCFVGCAEGLGKWLLVAWFYVYKYGCKKAAMCVYL